MKQNKPHKCKHITLRMVGIILLIIIIGLSVFFWHNTHYYATALRQVEKSGFIEKQSYPDEYNVINYAEGPNNGPALLLIHGQTGRWRDYAPVLKALSEHYHIFAIDCYGHGLSSSNPETYSAQAMGEDYVWFIENIINEPVVISGHSSGGLLTAWIAANAPDIVRGVVLEDPPFFSSEKDRCEQTFAWNDSHEPIHQFLSQDSDSDFVLFYLENCIWIDYFGEAKNGMVNYATYYRSANPNEPLKFFFMPPAINHIFMFMNDYDPLFGETFYDCTWHDNFDHAEALSQITCPSVLIHTNWSYDENGILMAAMSGDDARRAYELIEDCTLINVDSGHDVHMEEPDAFINILIDFLDSIEQ